jgi:DNA-binding GntR family transcriptional regulator
MSGHLRPIKLDSYKPLRELVCENIRQAIIDGTFSPGERLMEIQLADEMGVSRTPVREAIRKLELEGFVVMIPRRGTYVADISIKDINEVYEIRTSLDVLAAGLAAERINDDELETLQRLLVEIGQHIEENNMDKIVEVDIAFHDVLYQASRNERLRNIINNLREQITVIRVVWRIRWKNIALSLTVLLPAMLKEHRMLHVYIWKMPSILCSKTWLKVIMKRRIKNKTERG